MKKMFIAALFLFSCTKQEPYNFSNGKKEKVKFRVKVQESEQIIYSNYFETVK